MKAYLEPAEVEKLEQAAVAWNPQTGRMEPCARNRLLIRLLFRLGCRVSEALAVAEEDVDFDQGAVTIEHLKERLTQSTLPRP